MFNDNALRRTCAKSHLIFCLVILSVPISPAAATIINVPDDYGTIQAGIDAAVDGDTVLVAPGYYLENIKFRGKEIVVSSHFLLGQDPEYIFNTVIDGSNPVHPDSGSTVAILCDPGDPAIAPVFQGFTVTGGDGTEMWDPHYSVFVRKGGGIVTENGAPVIRFNYIHSNGIGSSEDFGGGGIHLGFGHPVAANNLIINNTASRGCGINVVYSDSDIRNNVIAHNFGGQLWSGAGIYLYLGTMQCVNNTIIYNISSLPGAGIKIIEGSATIRNTILWYNEAPADSQMSFDDASATVEYCNVQDGWEGIGNINIDPVAECEYAYLRAFSSSVDAGDPAPEYNDPADPGDPSLANWPALGGVRNDIGAYGGPWSFEFGPDPDGDGILNVLDNCRCAANVDQVDSDGDGWGDACDDCPDDPNQMQEDIDRDGVGDICDICPYDVGNDQDGDGHCESVDNCPESYNAGQEDDDFDGFGNVCDNCSEKYNPDQEDLNGDGTGDSCEINRTWYVAYDGTGDAPDIQSAIDSTWHGDTVVVGDGIYTDLGIDMRGRGILLKSENGPEYTIIDPQGTTSEPRRGLLIQDINKELCVIDGFTFRGGYGSMYSGSSSGGGVLCAGSDVTIKNCVFTDNGAVIGGAAFAMQSTVNFINCTFVGNAAYYGSAVLSFGGSSVSLENCLVAYNPSGQPASCFEFGTVAATCSDVFGNPAGDWVGGLAGQQALNNNLCIDPLFCGAETGEYGVRGDSPCAPDQNDCGMLIGACAVACECMCAAHCDMDGETGITPVDVVYIVNYVYKQLDARPILPACPGERGDWDCDGQANPVDVVWYVNYVYRALGDGPCDPCVE